MIKTEDLTGRICGRWYVESRAPNNPKRRDAYWNCICQCEKKTRKVVRSYSLRTGESKSCGCLQGEIVSKMLIEKFGLKEGEGAFNKLYSTYKKRGVNGYGFDLTKEEAHSLFKDDCYYCGIEPYASTGKDNNGLFIYNGIDRVDNDKGYTLENSVTCCIVCNKAKRDLTVEEFNAWCIRLSNRHGRRLIEI